MPFLRSLCPFVPLWEPFAICKILVPLREPFAIPRLPSSFPRSPTIPREQPIYTSPPNSPAIDLYKIYNMIQNDIQQRRLERRTGKSRLFSGLMLLIVGGALLLQKMSHPFPDWVFTWPMILILLGVFTGIRKKFRDNKWLIMVAIGGLALAGEINPAWDAKEYSVPVIIIGIGLLFLFRSRRTEDCDPDDMRNRFRRRFDGFGDRFDDRFNNEKKNFSNTTYNSTGSTEDMLDVVSIFGGTKKIITSKDFRGGEITSFLGGTELNLTQAEINGRVELDITNILGGTKLIVPSHWDIKPETVSVFGSIEDKRNLIGGVDPTKVLVLKGSSVFGGIEIRSF